MKYLTLSLVLFLSKFSLAVDLLSNQIISQYYQQRFAEGYKSLNNAKSYMKECFYYYVYPSLPLSEEVLKNFNILAVELEQMLQEIDEADITPNEVLNFDEFKWNALIWPHCGNSLQCLFHVGPITFFKNLLENKDIFQIEKEQYINEVTSYITQDVINKHKQKIIFEVTNIKEALLVGIIIVDEQEMMRWLQRVEKLEDLRSSENFVR